jgi:hypothetical protein
MAGKTGVRMGGFRPFGKLTFSTCLLSLRHMGSSLLLTAGQILAILLFLVINASAQSQVYTQILFKFGSTSPVKAQGIALDFSTNSYVVGSFTTNTTINGTLLPNASGWPNILLVRSRPGPLVWSRAPVTDYIVANPKVGCDGRGNSFVSGNFFGTNLTFGAISITNYASDHSGDVFWVKYDAGGTARMLNQAGGMSEDTLADMLTDTNGNSFLTGTFQSAIFFAGLSNLTCQSVSGGDCFTIKYDSNGQVNWLKQGTFAHGTCLALDAQTNCYVGGFTTGSSVFDGQSPANAITTNFLAKYSDNGALVWIRGDVNIGKYLKADAGQNLYIAGTFGSSVQLGSITLSNSATRTIFVAKCDPNGNILWARPLPGLGNDDISGLSIDGRTNCWICGDFASAASPSNTVAIIAQFDSSGNLNAISQISPTNVSAASGIASITGGSKMTATFICGSYTTNFTFYGHSVTNFGNSDIFVSWVLASPLLAATFSSTNIICSWPAGDTNLVLESTVDFSSWSTVTNHVSSSNGQITVSNAISGNSKFFRLGLH